MTTRTLRFYEQQGLIDPLRRGRTRLYRPADRTRLKLILRGRRLGFSLSEIRDIVGMDIASVTTTTIEIPLIDRIEI